MNRWVRLALLAVILLALGLTARRWLPALLAFVDANTDRLQGLEALAQLGLLALSALTAFFGWRAWRDRRSDAASVAATAQNSSQAIAQSGGAGQVAVTGGVGGDVTAVTVAVLDPAQLERLLGALLPTRAPVDLREQTQAYLEHVVASYRYLDFRGMGMGDRVALRLPLLEMYVPLKARVERPQGETWARDLRLAGRRPTAEEAEAMGQRLSEPTPVLELLQRRDGLVLLGDPGAGKTTFLKYVGLHLALGREAELGLAPRLPVLAPLSAYANALAVRDTPLDRFIADYYRERGIDLPLGAMLDQALAAGRAMLLLDGLDEVKDLARRRDVINRVVDFFTVQRRRGNKFILTSRIVGYDQVRRPIEGLTECTLVDFDDDDIALFIAKWTLAIERAVQGTEQVAALSAEQERAELLAAVQRNPGVRRLAANPLLLTVLALMKRQGVRLPERRVELYEQYVDILVQHWNLARGLGRAPAYSPDVKQVRKVLAPLALWMHETSPGVGLVKEQAMRRKLGEIYAAAQVDDPERASDLFLADVRDHANLLVERGSRQYGFIHLTFQEYLAAVALAQQGQQSVAPVATALAAHVGDDNWREPSLLAVGYLGVVQDRPEAAGAVLSALVRQRPGPAGAAVVLAGQALLDVGDVGVTPACRDEVIAALQAAMTDRELPAGQRLAAGLALADLNVLPPDLDELVAAPEWGFAIGRYPVTNAQFRRFVDAGGYDRRRKWWSQRAIDAIMINEGGRWPDGPRLWDDERFNHRTQPVVGVSWYEAQAYCAWLTEKLRGCGVLTAAQEVRLPTRAQWKQAAASSHRKAYPWGSDVFDAKRANTEESGLRQTTPVCMYPEGATPEGVYDLAGNVWEWTADLDEDGWPWLKGGAYWSDSEDVGASAANRSYPGNWRDFDGLRVVVVPVSRSGLVLDAGC